jgi:hypothetical protein
MSIWVDDIMETWLSVRATHGYDFSSVEENITDTLM